MSQAPPRGDRRGLLIVLAVIGFAILCALGTWQVQRLIWKQDLIARVEERIDLSPVAAPGPETWPGIDYEALDYLPVTVSGEFLHEQEIHAFTALSSPAGEYEGQGYFVLTPLVTDAGWVVLVNRGFVPEAFKDPASRQAGQTVGEVEIAGLARPPQGRNAFTPPDDPDANMWFTRDPATIAPALELDGAALAPYYIDAFFDPALPNGLPQGGETAVTFPNNHLQYVVTWFGLAAVLAVMTFLRVRAGRRKTDRSEETASGAAGGR